MLIRKKLAGTALIALLLSVSPFLTACEEEKGTFEEMGEAADEALEEAAKAVEETAGKVEEKAEEHSN